ncbi:MAG TPA: hypothetical protein VE134_10090, partial [Methanomicrobiales archaeon]|nr:hypothetical protein [Methanomicrobiales archaeon]
MPEAPILRGCKRRYSEYGCYRLILEGLLLVSFFLLVLPISLGLILGIPSPIVFSLIGSTLVFQAAA